MKQNSEYKKDWYKKNKKRILESRKEKYLLDHEASKKTKRESYVLNKEKILSENKKWRESNKEQIKKRKKIYNSENKDVRNKRNSIRKKEEPLFKLKGNIRSLIVSAFKNKGYSKKTKTCEILCCSFLEFKVYLESKFEPWMTWENQGKYNGELNYGWDIDHIIPLTSAKSEGDVIKLNHYLNLQPLCSKFNRDIKRGNV